MKVYDLIILGAGPAGITASVYAARKGLDFLVISKDIGGQASISGNIENYTGYQFITGPELVSKFQKHLDMFGIKINIDEEVKEIKKENSLIETITDKDTYFSKTLIIATGKRPRPLEAEGEKEFKNRGITYCATCDGPLFKGKNVAIIGGGNSALDATLQMMKVSPKIYIINIGSNLIADPIMIENIQDSPSVEIWNNSRVKRIYGDSFVKGIEIEKERKIYSLEVEGVFVEIGLIPNSEFAKILKQNDKKEIEIDCFNHTSIRGIFACGDVTNVPEKQIIVACGEGAKALLGAFKYLSTHRF
jgi:thioredoxin-disulfide reductase